MVILNVFVVPPRVTLVGVGKGRPKPVGKESQREERPQTEGGAMVNGNPKSPKKNKEGPGAGEK